MTVDAASPYVSIWETHHARSGVYWDAPWKRIHYAEDYEG